MERIIKFGTTIRNNWKKSVFGAVALSYGVAKLKEKYEINILMVAACKEAVKYGDSLIPMERNPTMVTVILNPVANKRKAKAEFEKYCEPILNLAGLQVEIIQTTSEGNAKEIVETLRGTEAIIVAGGDGTLSETITGLLRRTDGANQFPVGILPVGSTNTLANSLFPGGKGVDKVKQLIDASMAIVKGNTMWKDAMKIEQIEATEEPPTKPVYALNSIEWGVFRDTLAKKDKYWIYGSLRAHAAFVFNGYKKGLNWVCSGTVRHTPPCEGCSNCLPKVKEPPKRWLFFMPNEPAPKPEKNIVENPECQNVEELCFKTSDIIIKTANMERTSQVPALNIKIGKNLQSYKEFVTEGWNRLKGTEVHTLTIPVRTVELLPQVDKEDLVMGIDQEEFEVKPVKITLLPKVVKLFCKPDASIRDEYIVKK